MKEIVEKLKNTKDLTREKYEEMIYKYSHEAVIRQLKEAGLTLVARSRPLQSR